MSSLYVIRHGQARFDSDNYDRLSSLGVRQSEILGDHLVRLGQKLDAIFCGSLTRQTQTVEAILSRLKKAGHNPPVEVDPGFNEHQTASIMVPQLPDILGYMPQSRDEVVELFSDNAFFKKVYEQAMTRWMAGHFEPEEAETWPEFRGRVKGAMLEVVDKSGRGANVAIVSSGGPISVMMRTALGLSDQKTLGLTWNVKNSSITHFKFDDDRISLVSFNSVAHLEAAGDPGLITYR